MKANTSLFIALVCLALVALHVWSSWSARILELSKAETETRNIAIALSEQAENTIKTVDTVLVGLVERVEMDGMSPTSMSSLKQLLLAHLAELAPVQGLFVYDEEGRWVVNSAPGQHHKLNNLDREYFVFHLTHRDRGPHIGTPVISRTSNVWVIPISRRINHPDGSFAGVVLATVKLDFFRKLYDSMDVGQSGTIFLARDDGTLYLRKPFDPARIGANIANGPFFKLYKSGTMAGTAVLRASIDHIERIYSYRHLRSYPVLVAVARSKDELLTDWYVRTVWFSVGVLFLIVSLLTIGSRLIHQVVARDRLETELREAKAALEESNVSLMSLALSDGLTGLSNRRHFDEILGSEYRLSRRNGRPLALLLMDVDFFKKYNDLYGHQAGDECLRRIGSAIQSGKRRPSDLAARYGGEEFVVLLPDTSKDGAWTVAERIRQAVQSLKLEHLANPAGIITVSVGVHVLEPTSSDGGPVELVRRADQALYAAKSNGRNRVVML